MRRVVTRLSSARSLLARILIYGLLLLALAWASLLVVSRLVLDPAQQRRSLAFASFVAKHLPSEPEALTRELDEPLRALGADATAYDLEGAVLASNVTPPRPFPRALADEAARLGAAVVDERTTLAALRAPDGRHVGFVLLARPPIPIRRSALLFGLMLVFIAGASVPLARSIASPLAALGKAARAFGGGDLGARSGVTRDDEVGQVARAFDEMAARVEASIRSEKELLANVSHELRTPLARIRVALESAADKPERAIVCLPEVAGDLAELERLVDDVLTTARLDTTLTGPWPGLSRALVDARDLADDAARRFARVTPAARSTSQSRPASSGPSPIAACSRGCSTTCSRTPRSTPTTTPPSSSWPATRASVWCSRCAIVAWGSPRVTRRACSSLSFEAIAAGRGRPAGWGSASRSRGASSRRTGARSRS